jgi:ribosomal protein L11 methyltransferase
MAARDPHQKADGFGAVVVDVPEKHADDLAGLLAADSLGVESAPAGPWRTRLRVFVRQADRDGALRRARETVRAFVVDDAREPAWEPVEERDWVGEYQRRLVPFPLGQRFLVVPGDREAEAPGRETIRLVPGRAFGTGEHPTTRMCAEALEHHLEPGSRWLDLGTGSGILAIVAARCGAASVRAVDLDPEAIEVAREVLRANPGARGITAAVGSLDGLAPGSFDGVVANIAASYFVAQPARTAAVLRPGGTLVASGFIRDDRAEIEDRLRAVGLHPLASREEGDWLALVFRREEAS